MQKVPENKMMGVDLAAGKDESVEHKTRQKMDVLKKCDCKNENGSVTSYPPGIWDNVPAPHVDQILAQGKGRQSKA